MSNRRSLGESRAVEAVKRVQDLIESTGSDYVSVYAVAAAIQGIAGGSATPAGFVLADHAYIEAPDHEPYLDSAGRATQGAAEERHDYSDGVSRYPNVVTYNVRPPCVDCGNLADDPIHRRATQGAAPTPAPSMFIGGKPVNPNETVHLGLASDQRDSTPEERHDG